MPAQEAPQISPENRLVGVDLMRGLAVFGVAVLHSGSSGPAEGLAGQFELFFNFAVPFFLITSFYFSAKKIYSFKPFKVWSRVPRLLLPYITWTVIYIVFSILKNIVSGSGSKLPKLFSDPFSIIFVGSPGYHLYFIPLLLIGTFLLPGAAWLVHKKIRIRSLILLLIIGSITYQFLISSGNSFILGKNIAFQSFFSFLELDIQNHFFLRLVSVFLAWALRCLPYICLALLWQHPSIQKQLTLKYPRAELFSGLAFLAINIWGVLVLPKAIYEIVSGSLALIFALTLSTMLRTNAWIRNLGQCSFGIFLMHLIWVETCKTVLGRFLPGLLDEVSVYSLVIYASLACIVSWLITSFLIRRKGFLAQVLFGYG